MSMDIDFQNENDYKDNRAKVRTTGADWVWVRMTFQNETGTNNRNNENLVSFYYYFTVTIYNHDRSLRGI